MSTETPAKFNLFRDDARPLEFTGFEVGAVCVSESVPLKRMRAAVYRTMGGTFVSEYASWQGPDDNSAVTAAKVATFPTLELAVQWFRPGPITTALLERLRDELEPEQLRDEPEPEQLEGGHADTAGARMEAERLLASARGFASILDSSVANAGEHAFDGPKCAVAFFILAQAAELAMKAFLRSSGVSLSELAHVYGHDLKRALHKSRRLGFASPALPNIWFDPLSRSYMKGKQLQYPNVDGFSLPPILATREMVDGFIYAAAERVRGVTPTPDVGIGIGFSAAYPGWSLQKAISTHPGSP